MKKRYLIFLFAALLLLLCGCGSKKEVKTGYQIYYLNSEQTKLNPREYHPKSKDAEGMVKEFLRELSSAPEDVEYQKPIPNDVEITKYRIEGDQLSVWMDSDYYNMDAATEVFCRAAVVRTMTQIPDISCVSFFVGDSPLVDSKNNVVGLMTAESFVENPGEQINAIQTTTLTLYFSNRDGDALVKETQTVDTIFDPFMGSGTVLVESMLSGAKNVFGNDKPIHIEIGMGKGDFIIGMAKNNPNINFIGIEMYDSVIVKAVQKLENEELDNLKLIRMDARLIEDVFDKEIDLIYLNFSDPWPKSRAAKKRLTHERFLNRYENIFKGKKTIFMKTDNAALFEFSIESLSEFGYKLKNISLDLHNSDFKNNVMTEYERKFSEKGVKINRLEAYKD